MVQLDTALNVGACKSLKESDHHAGMNTENKSVK